MPDELPYLRRIAFVAQRYGELRNGLLGAWIGAMFTVAALAARATLGRGGSISGLVEMPALIGISLGVVPIEAGYRLTFGRAMLTRRQDLIAGIPLLCVSGAVIDLPLYVLRWNGPSIGAVLFVLCGVWVVCRDGRWRLHYALLAAAGTIGIALTGGLPPSAGDLARAIAYIRSYALIGMALVAVGVLDHRLLVTSLSQVQAPPPPARASRLRFAGSMCGTVGLFAGILAAGLLIAGSDDDLLGATLYLSASVSFCAAAVFNLKPWRLGIEATRARRDLFDPARRVFRLPLTLAPLVVLFLLALGSGLDAMAMPSAFPLATTIAIAAASVWFVMQGWPARSHYLIGAVSVVLVAVVCLAHPVAPVRAFTWLVLASSASLAIAALIDYRRLQHGPCMEERAGE